MDSIILHKFNIPFKGVKKKVVKKTHAHRDTDANIPHFYCLVISSFILFAGFLTANIACSTSSRVHSNHSEPANL